MQTIRVDPALRLRLIEYLSWYARNPATIIELCMGTLAQDLDAAVESAREHDSRAMSEFHNAFSEYSAIVIESNRKVRSKIMAIMGIASGSYPRDLHRQDLGAFANRFADEMRPIIARWGDSLDASAIVETAEVQFDECLLHTAVSSLFSDLSDTTSKGAANSITRIATATIASGDFPDGGYAEISLSREGNCISHDRLRAVLATDFSGNRTFTKIGGFYDCIDFLGGRLLGEIDQNGTAIFRIRLPLNPVWAD